MVWHLHPTTNVECHFRLELLSQRAIPEELRNLAKNLLLEQV